MFEKIIKTTFKNIWRNKTLSFAMFVVTVIVIATASFMISTTLITRQSGKVLESRAPTVVYFNLDAPEENILEIREQVSQLNSVEEVNYIDQEQALEIFNVKFADNPEFVDTVTADWLPASLEIYPQDIESTTALNETITDITTTSPHVDEIKFQEDIAESIQLLSSVLFVLSVAVIIIFSIITIALIVITISFNIRTHKEEIEIMHLMGSPDKFIKTPFILEGVFNTGLGATIASLLIIGPWIYVGNNYADNDIYFVITDILREANLAYLINPDNTFIAGYIGIHLLIGIIIGFIGSYIAVSKYLRLKTE